MEEEEDEASLSGVEARAYLAATHRVYPEYAQILETDLSPQLVKRVKQLVNCRPRPGALHVALTASSSAGKVAAEAPHARCNRRGRFPVLEPVMAELAALTDTNGQDHQAWADESEIESGGKDLVMGALHMEQ